MRTDNIKITRLIMAAMCIVMLPSLAFAQNPTSREYPYLYKSPRAMGMGGAYIATGGAVDTLFYNPAGLSNLPEDKGWEFNMPPFNWGFEAGKNTMDFVNDMGDAFDVEDGPDADMDPENDQMRAVNDVLASYRGKNLHALIQTYSSIGKGYEKIAFGVSGFGTLRLDLMTHQGFGPEGFLEVNADATAGGIGGMSYKINEDVAAGASLKFLHREALVHNFTVRELVEKQDSLGDYIVEDLRTSGDAVGLDTGVIWKFMRDSWFRPSIGASIMNVGGLKFGDAGEIPMTVNAGVAVNPEIPYIRSLTVAFDYVDMFNGYEQDSDMAKRTRFGVEAQIIDKTLVAAAVSAGLYEGYPTFGLNLRFTVINFSFVSYSEEIGAYSGQERDSRQFVMLGIGW